MRWKSQRGVCFLSTCLATLAWAVLENRGLMNACSEHLHSRDAAAYQLHMAIVNLLSSLTHLYDPEINPNFLGSPGTQSGVRNYLWMERKFSLS